MLRLTVLFDYGHVSHSIRLTNNGTVLTLASFDVINDVHALGHFTNHGVLTIQEMVVGNT